MLLPDYISETRKYLLDRGVTLNPEAAVILGSGLGSFSKAVDQIACIPYHKIPYFHPTSVAGHSGELIFGEIAGKKLIAFSGRFHHYEGHDFETTALPVYLAKAMNAQKLIISNAAGSVNTRFKVGDLMVIDSIIRLNGITSPFHPGLFRFNLEPYARKAREIASETGLMTQEGSYLFLKGPNYETKAEIRAFRILGVDAVGMSTVPELTEACRLKIKTVAISLITNMAAGIENGKLDHSEVKNAADSREDDFARFVLQLIEHL